MFYHTNFVPPGGYPSDLGPTPTTNLWTTPSWNFDSVPNLIITAQPSIYQTIMSDGRTQLGSVKDRIALYNAQNADALPTQALTPVTTQAAPQTEAQAAEAEAKSSKTTTGVISSDSDDVGISDILKDDGPLREDPPLDTAAPDNGQRFGSAIAPEDDGKSTDDLATGQEVPPSPNGSVTFSADTNTEPRPRKPKSSAKKKQRTKREARLKEVLALQGTAKTDKASDSASVRSSDVADHAQSADIMDLAAEPKISDASAESVSSAEPAIVMHGPNMTATNPREAALDGAAEDETPSEATVEGEARIETVEDGRTLEDVDLGESRDPEEVVDRELPDTDVAAKALTDDPLPLDLSSLSTPDSGTEKDRAVDDDATTQHEPSDDTPADQAQHLDHVPDTKEDEPETVDEASPSDLLQSSKDTPRDGPSIEPPVDDVGGTDVDADRPSIADEPANEAAIPDATASSNAPDFSTDQPGASGTTQAGHNIARAATSPVYSNASSSQRTKGSLKLKPGDLSSARDVFKRRSTSPKKVIRPKSTDTPTYEELKRSGSARRAMKVVEIVAGAGGPMKDVSKTGSVRDVRKRSISEETVQDEERDQVPMLDIPRTKDKGKECHKRHDSGHADVARNTSSSERKHERSSDQRHEGKDHEVGHREMKREHRRSEADRSQEQRSRHGEHESRSARYVATSSKIPSKDETSTSERSRRHKEERRYQDRRATEADGRPTSHSKGGHHSSGHQSDGCAKRDPSFAGSEGLASRKRRGSRQSTDEDIPMVRRLVSGLAHEFKRSFTPAR